MGRPLSPWRCCQKMIGSPRSTKTRTATISMTGSRMMPATRAKACRQSASASRSGAGRCRKHPNSRSPVRCRIPRWFPATLRAREVRESIQPDLTRGAPLLPSSARAGRTGVRPGDHDGFDVHAVHAIFVDDPSRLSGVPTIEWPTEIARDLPDPCREFRRHAADRTQTCRSCGYRTRRAVRAHDEIASRTLAPRSTLPATKRCCQ